MSTIKPEPHVYAVRTTKYLSTRFVGVPLNLRGMTVHLQGVTFSAASMAVAFVFHLIGLTVDLKCIAFSTVSMVVAISS